MVKDEQMTNELKTREYSVYISDSKKSACGSGLLYYPGRGDLFYVFTCAHVLDDMQTIELKLLMPDKPEKDIYSVYKFTVPPSQAVYYPLDEIKSNESGEKIHSHDVAVIPVKKPEQLDLKGTQYYIAEAHCGDEVYAHGFPGGCNDGEDLLEALDVSYGTVLSNIPNKQTFMMRLKDSFINASDRVSEMEGFSGSSVWNLSEGKLSALGLLSSGFRDLYRAKFHAVKIEYIRTIMKNTFNVQMESKIQCIPEADVAQSGEQCFDGAMAQFSGISSFSKDWAKQQMDKIRALIDDLKMQRAIDLCKQTIADLQFEKCDAESQKRLMQHLLYCYEISQSEDDFTALENEMNRRGFLKGHDPIRRMTGLFGKCEYGKAQSYAEQVLKDNPDHQIAKLFSVICKAYTEGAAEEQTVRQFVDDKEQLTIKIQDKDTQSLAYQMIGFVYSTHYRRHEKAVRCLNRAYRLGADKVILETLAMAYYFLAIKDAVDKDDKIIPEKIDRESLFKARECYLIILDKADELFLKGTVKMAGLPLYNTFVFSQDSYRVLSLYPLIIKYLTFPDNEKLRDVEMKYARIRCMEGKIDTSQFKALTDADKTFLTILSDINKCMTQFEGDNIDNSDEAESYLKDIICRAEKILSSLNDHDGLGIRINLINLYGKGITLFGWDAIADIKNHYVYIKQSGNEQLIAAMENFIFELEHPFEEAVKVFRRSFENNPSVETWIELRNLYLRHGRLDMAERLYGELFSDYTQIYSKEPEFAIRSYLDFIIKHRLDLKYAIQCFMDNKDKFNDTDIAAFWELELMSYTFSFNNPERFEQERWSYVEKGLIPEIDYHLNALVAYTANLNEVKAKEHFEALNIKPGDTLYRECFHYLVWQKKIYPPKNSVWKGMVPDRIERVTEDYKNETWRSKAEDFICSNKFQVERTLAVDAWALYLLAESDNLHLLDCLDCIFVTHNTINRIMFELSNYPNFALHMALDYLKNSKHVYIRSADFEHQLAVRNKALYDEPASTVAIAQEVGCPAVLGQPELNRELIGSFANIIVRPYDLISILKK